MKLEIYEPKKEEKKEEPVRLALRKESDGTITVIAVNEDGERLLCGNLIFFRSDGTIEKAGSVNNSLGFQLDERERIKCRN